MEVRTYCLQFALTETFKKNKKILTKTKSHELFHIYPFFLLRENTSNKLYCIMPAILYIFFFYFSNSKARSEYEVSLKN